MPEAEGGAENESTVTVAVTVTESVQRGCNARFAVVGKRFARSGTSFRFRRLNLSGGIRKCEKGTDGHDAGSLMPIGSRHSRFVFALL